MWALVGGLIALVVGIVLLAASEAMRGMTLFVIGGGVVLLLLLGGLIAVASGISDIKDRLAEKKEESEPKPESKPEEKQEEKAGA